MDGDAHGPNYLFIFISLGFDLNSNEQVDSNSSWIIIMIHKQMWQEEWILSPISCTNASKLQWHNVHYMLTLVFQRRTCAYLFRTWTSTIYRMFIPTIERMVTIRICYQKSIVLWASPLQHENVPLRFFLLSSFWKSFSSMLVIFQEIVHKLFNHSMMHKFGYHHSNAHIQDDILQNPTQASTRGEERTREEMREVGRIVALRRGKLGEEKMRSEREWKTNLLLVNLKC